MQTAYALNPEGARTGMLYDGGEHDIVTRISAVAQPFGTFVIKTAGDGLVAKVAAVAGATSVLEGVVVYSQSIQSGLAGDGVTPAVEAGKPINILRKGRIWVYCETDFNPDTDTLFVRFTANGAGKIVGQVRKDADTGKGDELGASGYGVAYTALNTLTAAGFLALDINLPSTVR
jgi:hypothetical protein